MTACEWHDVCGVDEVPVDRGIAVLVAGEPVALFRLSPLDPEDGDEWYAVSHVDPVSRAPVMARGLVGSVPAPGGGPSLPTVAAPLHKQRYDLRTGRCLDDVDLALGVHAVCVTGDRVLIRLG
ncbi:MAG: nitrite reductase (NAD(P)H) small subunit [Actinomycetota bacterium]